MHPLAKIALLAIVDGKGNEPMNAPDEDRTYGTDKDWHCNDCGWTDYDKPMPNDREAFYKNLAIRQGRGIGGGVGGYQCPACKEFTLLPRGF